MLKIAIVEDHESDAKRLTALLEAYAQKNGKRFGHYWIANANTFLDSYSTSMSWCLWTFGCRG